MMRSYLLLIICWLSALTCRAAEWQWSIELKGIISSETNAHPRAFLWIPSNCTQVRAVVLGKHNMSEEGIMEHPDFRKTMSELGIAEIWITPGIDINWDVTQGTQDVFEQMMKELADISGYTELQYAPIIPMGHSAMATYPWNFGAWNPERTLAILSVHGDSPRTHLTGYGRPNLDWAHRTIEGIPGLVVMGEYEWWEDRLFTAFDYRRAHPDAPLSLLADAGHGHFDHSDELVNYLALFIKKAAYYRLPQKMPLDKPAQLNPVHAKSGWLADRWRKDEPPHAQAAPYATYQGNPDSVFWYFDKEMAEATAQYYAKVRGKKAQYVSFVQQGQLLHFNPKHHAGITAQFMPQEDGVTFTLHATYTDSTRSKKANVHSSGKIKISRICGPVQHINDTTFRVSFYRMGLDNPKRTPDIWLLASTEGDDTYKSTVQQLNMRIPYRITNGNAQSITFDALPDVSHHTTSLKLNAVASSRLPAYYYIKEGPAFINNNEVVFTPIPPKATYPIKVTVVAWQYGKEGEWNTAEAQERSFNLIMANDIN